MVLHLQRRRGSGRGSLLGRGSGKLGSRLLRSELEAESRLDRILHLAELLLKLLLLRLQLLKLLEEGVAGGVGKGSSRRATVGILVGSIHGWLRGGGEMFRKLRTARVSATRSRAKRSDDHGNEGRGRLRGRLGSVARHANSISLFHYGAYIFYFFQFLYKIMIFLLLDSTQFTKKNIHFFLNK